MATQVAEAYLKVRADMSDLYQNLGDARAQVSSIFSDIASTLGAGAGAVWSTTKLAAGAALEALDQVIPASFLLSEGFKLAGTAASTLFGVIGGLASGVKQFALGAFAGVLGAVGSVVGLLTENIMLVAQGFGAMFDGIKNMAMAWVTGLTGVLSGLVHGVTEVAKQGIDLAARFAAYIIENVANMAAAVVAPAMAVFTQSLTDFHRWITLAASVESQTARIAAMLRGSGEAAGWSASQLDVMAHKMAALGGYSFQAIRETQATLLRFQNVRGDQFLQAMQAARQLAAVMGGDMPRAAQMLGRALEDPMRGMFALRRIGIVLSQEQQQQLKAAFASQDIVAAQQLLFDRIGKLGNAAGGVADTMMGKNQQLRLSWEYVGLAIGEALLPVSQIFTEVLLPIIQGFSEGMVRWLTGVAGQSRDSLNEVKAWVAQNRDTLMSWGESAAGVVQGIVEKVGAALGYLGGFVGSVFASFGDRADVSLSDIMEMVERTLAAVGTGVENTALSWDVFKASAGVAWAWLLDTAGQALDYIWLKIQNIFLNTMDWIKLVGMHAAAMLTGGMSDAEEEALERGRLLDQQIRTMRERYAAQGIGRGGARTDDAMKALEAELARFREAMANANLGINNMETRARRAAEAAADAVSNSLAMAPGPVEPAEWGKFKFAFAGLEDMSKRLQTAMTGGGMEGLARQGVQAARDILGALGNKLDPKLGRMADALDAMKNKPAGFGV